MLLKVLAISGQSKNAANSHSLVYLLNTSFKKNSVILHDRCMYCTSKVLYTSRQISSV